MKIQKKKKLLIRLGLWYPLNKLRSVPEMMRWMKSGYNGAAPHSVKMMVVGSYLKKFSLDNFVETGTFHGDTLGYIAKSGVRCTSIELSTQLYQDACRRFKSCKNVKLVQGDSGEKLAELLREINEPTLFWLDGHYSSGITASAKIDTPISAELKAILCHSIKRHVILIDDARCFDGTNDYPYLDDLLRVIRDDSNYRVDVTTDIIRLIPCVV